MYCDVDDLISATSEKDLIQLTDDEKSGSYNLERINKAITAATDEINGYCMVRYSGNIPFSTVPGLINSVCVEIAIYILHKRRDAVTKKIRERYEDAKEILDKIAKGTIKLMVGDEEVAEDTVDFSNKTPDDRIFKDPQGYIE